MLEKPPIRRRKSQRFGQHGAVTLRRNASSSPVTGSCFDISSGGCLIWTDRHVVFDPAELIEIKLQADGVQFRVMGTVRHVSEGGRLLGVEFQHISVADTLDLEVFITKLQAAADQENARLELD